MVELSNAVSDDLIKEAFCQGDDEAIIYKTYLFVVHGHFFRYMGWPDQKEQSAEVRALNK